MASTTSSQPVHGAKALFWYLSLFFTLGIVAFSTGAIWFQLINKLVPLEVVYGGVTRAFSQGLVKNAIASLIVGTPVFLIFSWLIRKAINRGEVALDRGVRQWITYLILFVVVATAIGDVIAVIYSLLNGDFTARFLLKATTILVITGWIFAYFWLEIRSNDALKGKKLPFIMMIAAAVVVLISIIAGFFLIDSPAVARAKAFDQQRMSDITFVQGQVQNHYRINGALPDSLQTLVDEGDIIEDSVRDPQTKQPYEYRKIDAEQFEVCATFTTDNKTDDSYDNGQFYSPTGKPMLHGVGRTCFTENATPDYERGMMIEKPVAAPIL
jgi:hypothetical protein